MPRLKGFKHSKKTLKKMSLAKKGKPCDFIKTKFKKGEKSVNWNGFKVGQTAWNKGKPFIQIRGEKHYFWKGGITPINFKIRNSLEYKLWRNKVFERDNYTCIKCQKHSGNGKRVILHADHIKSFAKYPELRFEVNNGRTLCKECHLSNHGLLTMENLL